jgi:hypothetical protein
MIKIRHRAKLSKGDEMAALQKSDKKLNRQQGKELVRRLWSSSPGLDVVHRNAAGIDVGNEEHYVAIAATQDEVPVQRFACFTAELIRMAVWLKGRGVQTVAMQSTGVYWICPSRKCHLAMESIAWLNRSNIVTPTARTLRSDQK